MVRDVVVMVVFGRGEGRRWQVVTPARGDPGRQIMVEFDRLHALPPDLADLGWQVVITRCRTINRARGTQYEVVYERAVDPEVDRSTPGVAIDRGRFHVRKRSWSSWADAREQAIGTMRAIDSKRQR